MQLGAFSISLSVRDLARSMSFYEDLGFSRFGGSDSQGYAIMKSGETLIGLFQGMFERNLLTFNPGWNQSAENSDPFTDVRAIQSQVEAAGHSVEQVQGDASGPGSFVVVDPDGNPILIDQHR